MNTCVARRRLRAAWVVAGIVVAMCTITVRSAGADISDGPWSLLDTVGGLPGHTVTADASSLAVAADPDLFPGSADGPPPARLLFATVGSQVYRIDPSAATAVTPLLPIDSDPVRAVQVDYANNDDRVFVLTRGLLRSYDITTGASLNSVAVDTNADQLALNDLSSVIAVTGPEDCPGCHSIVFSYLTRTLQKLVDPGLHLPFSADGAMTWDPKQQLLFISSVSGHAVVRSDGLDVIENSTSLGTFRPSLLTVDPASRTLYLGGQGVDGLRRLDAGTLQTLGGDLHPPTPIVALAPNPARGTIFVEVAPHAAGNVDPRNTLLASRTSTNLLPATSGSTDCAGRSALAFDDGTQSLYCPSLLGSDKTTSVALAHYATGAAPAITTQPVDVTVTAGAHAATFESAETNQSSGYGYPWPAPLTDAVWTSAPAASSTFTPVVDDTNPNRTGGFTHTCVAPQGPCPVYTASYTDSYVYAPAGGITAADNGRQLRVAWQTSFGRTLSAIATIHVIKSASYSTHLPPGSPALIGTAGRPYQLTIAATGLPAPTIVLAAGHLPAGLVLEENGVIDGTPTTTGRYVFTLTASNDIGAPAEQTLAITIERTSASTVNATPPPTTAAVTTNLAAPRALAATGSPVTHQLAAGTTLFVVGLIFLLAVRQRRSDEKSQ